MFETLTKELLDEFFDKNPHWASHIGLHDPYDYQLPKGDTAHVLENHRLLETYVNRMTETIEYKKLTNDNKIDWHVLTKALERSRFEIEEQRQHELNPNAFDDIGSVFFMMISRDYAPLAQRIDAMIARIKQLPQYLIEFQSRFDHTQPVTLWTDIAIESAHQIPELFQFIIITTKEKIPEELHQRLQDVIEKTFQLMKKHGLTPINCNKEESIRSRIMLSYIGYLMLSLLRKKLDDGTSLGYCLTTLDGIREVSYTDGSKELPELTKSQKEIMEKVGLM